MQGTPWNRTGPFLSVSTRGGDDPTVTNLSNWATSSFKGTPYAVLFPEEYCRGVTEYTWKAQQGEISAITFFGKVARNRPAVRKEPSGKKTRAGKHKTHKLGFVPPGISDGYDGGSAPPVESSRRLVCEKADLHRSHQPVTTRASHVTGCELVATLRQYSTGDLFSFTYLEGHHQHTCSSAGDHLSKRARTSSSHQQQDISSAAPQTSAASSNDSDVAPVAAGTAAASSPPLA